MCVVEVKALNQGKLLVKLWGVGKVNSSGILFLSKCAEHDLCSSCTPSSDKVKNIRPLGKIHTPITGAFLTILLSVPVIVRMPISHES